MEVVNETVTRQSFINKYHDLLSMPNVSLNFGPVTAAQKHPFEQVYMHGLMTLLASWKYFNDFDIYVIGANAPWDYEIDDRSIVFYLSNEDHSIDPRLLAAHAIFTPYCPTNNCPKNCFPIPLGYNGSIPEKSIQPIENRKIDVFFSGNIYKRRLPFAAGVVAYKARNIFNWKKPNDYFQFNRVFGGGLEPLEYADVLMNTKVALVPEGYLSNVSFRFFEAARYGCIIISPKLYDYWFFKAFPGIVIEHWLQLPKTLSKLQKSQDWQADLHEKTLDYYSTYCSEKAVAAYIVQTLEGLNTGANYS